MQVTHINTGTARPLRIEGRSFLSAIGKTPVSGARPSMSPIRLRRV